jgi:hypothetical protein
MTTKRFLTSVADVFAYDDSDNIVFTAKTLLDSSMDVTLGSTPIRGGRGSQLQYIFYHTAEMKFTLTDTQFNLAMLASTVGKSYGTGVDVYQEEDVTLNGSGTGSVTDTPLGWDGGATAYGWATSPLGVTERVTFATKSFTVAAGAGASGQKWCVRYYALNSAANYFTIDANIIPKVVKLVMETQLNSADVTTNKIGVVQLIVPRATLSGAFNIAMKADGVSTTPLTANALAFTESTTTGAGCTNAPYYAKLIEIIDSANWYDNVIALAIQGGDFALTHPATSTLVVWAIPSGGGAAFPAPLGGQLDFASVTGATATINATTGVVTTVAGGTTLLTVHIHDKSTVEDSCTLTVS